MATEQQNSTLPQISAPGSPRQPPWSTASHNCPHPEKKPNKQLLSIILFALTSDLTFQKSFLWGWGCSSVVESSNHSTKVLSSVLECTSYLVQCSHHSHLCLFVPKARRPVCDQTHTISPSCSLQPCETRSQFLSPAKGFLLKRHPFLPGSS